MKIIAITGSIGCGKTTLAKIVKNMGYCVYDLDAWVRRLYYKKDFINIIAANFDDVVENCVVNKRRLRNLVFSDKNKLRELESLIHPFLKKQLKKVIRKNADKNDVFFLDIALLFEMGWDKYCDLVVVANVDDDVQKQRVMSRDNVSENDFNKINNVQMSKADKVNNADVVIDTNQRLNLLKLELLEIIDGIVY